MIALHGAQAAAPVKQPRLFRHIARTQGITYLPVERLKRQRASETRAAEDESITRTDVLMEVVAALLAHLPDEVKRGAMVSLSERAINAGPHGSAADVARQMMVVALRKEQA